VTFALAIVFGVLVVSWFRTFALRVGRDRQ
jgi:hypothetical protein